MSKYRYIIISLLIILFSIAYIELFIENTKVVVSLSKPWEYAVPHQNIPNGLSSLLARDCGVCHKQHYEEWQKSTHAQAWKDLQFQSELKKASSPFVCINCHIPLQNQQEDIIHGLENGNIYTPVREKNQHFDKELQLEGITCAGCHVRNNTVIGPTGSALAPHSVTKDVTHLSEQLCIGCHNATSVVTPTLVCSFETGDEWKAGPFFGKKNCISCHMPETQRSIVAGMPIRKSRFHSFHGSGIPKFDTLKPDRLESLDYTLSKVKNVHNTGDSLALDLKISNNHAGHRVPTGNPERFIIMEVSLLDGEGNEVHCIEERIGEHWEWYPKAAKLSDNNLHPGESKLLHFRYVFLTSGKYTLVTKVSKHRLTPESAQYNKLGENYPLFSTVFDHTDFITVK